jgi:hypothetical protein
MAIRGIPMSTIRARMRTFCSEAGFAGGRLYILLANGSTLSFRDLLRKSKARRELSESLRLGRLGILWLAISEASISIKNNARLIYTDQKSGRHLTAKVALPSFTRSGCLAREIKARRLLAIGKFPIPVPALIRYDSPGLRWIEEEYIEATEHDRPGEKCRLFLRHAQSLYAPLVRSRPLQAWLRRLHISWSELHDVFAEAGAALPEIAETRTWPVSLLHGDLSTGNMIIGRDGRLFLIDWEKCGIGPIAWDLKKLFLSEAHLVHEVLCALSGPSDLAPSSQMHIAIAIEILLRRRDRQRKLMHHVHHGGKKRDFALRLLSARDENLLAVISGRATAPFYRERLKATSSESSQQG